MQGDNDNIYQKLLARALKLLSYRPRSEHELRLRLSHVTVKSGKIKQMSIDTVIKTLKEDGLVNDLGFTQWWVQSRKRSCPKGKIILRKELQFKGIDNSVINEVLDTMCTKKDEKAMIQKLIQKRLPRYASQDKRTIRRKLTNYLLRRGFTFETTLRVIDEAL